MIIGVVMAVVLLMVGIELGPEVIYRFSFINATSMADVRLGSVLVLFAGFAPLFYYLGLVAGVITILVAAVKLGK